MLNPCVTCGLSVFYILREDKNLKGAWTLYSAYVYFFLHISLIKNNLNSAMTKDILSVLSSTVSLSTPLTKQ